MKKARSRAYPAIDLETAYQLLRGKLSRLGHRKMDRRSLARELGYANGDGGTGARKVAALVHYGLLDRDTKGYSLSRRGLSLLGLQPGTPDAYRVLRNTLEQPALFRDILERFQPQGRIPSDLAPLLTHDHGITKAASSDAADVFLRSALFAGVLAEDGAFVDPFPAPSIPHPSVSPVGMPAHSGVPEAGQVRRVPIVLPGWRYAYLEVPLDIEDRDLLALQGGVKNAMAAIRDTVNSFASAKVIKGSARSTKKAFKSENVNRARVLRHDFQRPED